MVAFLFGFAQIQADRVPDGIIPQDKRQAVGTGITSSTSTTTTTTMSSSTDPITSTPTPTSESTTDDVGTTPTTSASVQSPTDVSTSPRVTTPDGPATTTRRTTSTPDDTSSAFVSTETGKSSDVVHIGTGTINRSTLSKPTTITSALVTSETLATSFTSVWTSDGVVQSSVVSTDRVVQSTTGFATATILPSLQDSHGSGNSLSDSSKKIIGGVVGGVGGAILLGGIALVAWRLWGRKKRQRVPQDDYLDSQDGSIRKEEQASSPTGDYRNPNGSVNTASNF